MATARRLLIAALGGGGFVVPMTFIGAVVRRSTNQTIPNDTFRGVMHDTVVHDPYGFWDSDFPYRLTVPAGKAGWYQAGGHLRWDPAENANEGVRNQSIYVNGTVDGSGDIDLGSVETTYVDIEWPNSTLAGAYAMQPVSGPPMYFDEGDHLDQIAYMFVTGGDPVDLESSDVYSPLFWIMKVG